MQAQRHTQKYPKSSQSTQPVLKSNAHCRSLVDLSPQASAEKQNRQSGQHHHYSSVISHPDSNVSFNQCYEQKEQSGWRKIPISKQKQNVIKLHGMNQQANNTRVYQQERQPLSQCKDASNIARVIMAATNNNNNNNKNKSGNIPTRAVLSTKTSAKNISNIASMGRKNEILASILNPKRKLEARTSSQTSLRDQSVTSTHSKLSHLKEASYPAVILKQQLSKQKSEKSLPKQNTIHPSSMNTIAPTPTANPNPDYSLLLKLKEYIEQLKENESKYVQELDHMKAENRRLHEELTLCKDKIAVHQIREKELSRKIRQQQQEISNNNSSNNNSCSDGNDGNRKGDGCQQHMLIIQSLKNVISEQMSKIIQMETYKVQLQEQQKQRHNTNNNHNDYADQNNNRRTAQTSQQLKSSITDQHHRSKFEEVYSFKKRNNNKLDESSIYIEDEIINSDGTSEEQPPPQHININKQHPPHPNIKNRGRRDNASQESIPEPYNQLIRCLKSDSRVQPHAQSIDNQERDEIQTQSEEGMGAEEDEILHEVGKYLDNIRQNVRKC